MKKYLNNAGAGIMSQSTYNSIINHLSFEIEKGPIRAATMAKMDIDRFYSNASELIQCSPDEIAFIDSASRGFNLALHGCRINKHNKILTLSSEFGTNLIAIYEYAKKNELEVICIECDANGNFSLEEVEKHLKKNVGIVAISHVSAHGSIINPVNAIGELTKMYGVKYYIVDGCHAVGQINVNVQDMKCDAYFTTGRKWLCGPRGTGFLYINPGKEIFSTQFDLSTADLIISNGNVTDIKVRSDAKQFELWERSVANLLGLSNAIRECIDFNIDSISTRIEYAANQIRRAVTNNHRFRLIGEHISKSGIVGFHVKNNLDENRLLAAFSNHELIISSMHDWDCPLHFPKEVSQIFRISPHHDTNSSVIEEVVDLLTNFN